MTQVTGYMKAATAAVLLLGAVCAYAEPQHDGREASPPARAEQHQAPQGQPQRGPTRNQGVGPRPAPQAPAQRSQAPAPRFTPPARPQLQGQAPQNNNQNRNPNQNRPQFQPQQPQRFAPSQPDANRGANVTRDNRPVPGGQRFVMPRQGGSFHGAPRVPPFRGPVPGQYAGRGHGQWHGLPPGAPAGRPYWTGGNWRGSWWPRVYYDWNYPLYLSVLPGVYATYWWGNVPYYYVNNVYYTWAAGDGGYVVTEPPPALSDSDISAMEAEGETEDSADGATDYDVPAQQQIYAYPLNGQSSDQQARDKYECHQWAVQQSSFDPTNPGAAPSADASASYTRAMVACLQGRGYSAR